MSLSTSDEHTRKLKLFRDRIAKANRKGKTELHSTLVADRAAYKKSYAEKQSTEKSDSDDSENDDTDSREVSDTINECVCDQYYQGLRTAMQSLPVGSAQRVIFATMMCQHLENCCLYLRPTTPAMTTPAIPTSSDMSTSMTASKSMEMKKTRRHIQREDDGSTTTTTYTERMSMKKCMTQNLLYSVGMESSDVISSVEQAARMLREYRSERRGNVPPKDKKLLTRKIFQIINLEENIRSCTHVPALPLNLDAANIPWSRWLEYLMVADPEKVNFKIDDNKKLVVFFPPSVPEEVVEARGVVVMDSDSTHSIISNFAQVDNNVIRQQKYEIALPNNWRSNTHSTILKFVDGLSYKQTNIWALIAQPNEVDEVAAIREHYSTDGEWDFGAAITKLKLEIEHMETVGNMDINSMNSDQYLSHRKNMARVEQKTASDERNRELKDFILEVDAETKRKEEASDETDSDCSSENDDRPTKRRRTKKKDTSEEDEDDTFYNNMMHESLLKNEAKKAADDEAKLKRNVQQQIVAKDFIMRENEMEKQRHAVVIAK